MSNALTTPAPLPGGSPVRPRGVLAVASPAPEGWESGGIETSQACPTPIVRDKCLTITGGDPLTRPTLARFPAFIIEQGVECSTLSGTDVREQEARDALLASTDYALGLTLLNGVANGGAPSLDDATELGAYDDVVAAVAGIECAAAAAGKGEPYVLHATPGAAAYLANATLIDAAGRSPAGAAWIISSGYECDDDATVHRIWATGRVWAGVGEISARAAIDRRTNNYEAWADRKAVVGFSPCVLLTATFATVAPTP